jgi:hypothetical protein
VKGAVIRKRRARCWQIFQKQEETDMDIGLHIAKFNWPGRRDRAGKPGL